MPTPCLAPPSPPLQWDVFCRVIDNFGDIGVCWRLCAELAARGHRVRLWVDDDTPLHWMAPGAQSGTWPGVEVRRWEQSLDTENLPTLPPADVWIETFGCDIAPEFVAWYANSTRANNELATNQPAWINLEYLSAESYVERSHALPSPVMSGPAKGWTKHFFYPGFSEQTGGLLREQRLVQDVQEFVEGSHRAQWLAQQGITWTGEQLVSLFCYEPVALEALFVQLNAENSHTVLLVTAGRARRAVQAVLDQRAAAALPELPPPLHKLRIVYLPELSQPEFDKLLWSCDLNFVRGEDSVIRALWAGKPFVWQIYPQHDEAHLSKLKAFLDRLGANAGLRSFHDAWNSRQSPSSPQSLPLIDLPSWSEIVQLARTRWCQQSDLVSRLVDFVQKKR